MLVPILIDLLIGCSLKILAGWVGETLRAGARAVDAASASRSQRIGPE
jgi:hypothetical protein